MPISHTLLFSGVAVLFFATLLSAGEEFSARTAITEAPEPLWPAPAAETTAFLATAPVPAESPLPSVSRADLTPGDESFFLMTVRGGKKSRQYLVAIRADAAAGSEQSGFTMQPFALFSNTGHRIDYGVRPVALVVTITGPFGGKKDPPVGVTRLLANEEFLSQGFCNACGAFEKLAALGHNKANASLSLSSQPFPEEDVAANLAALGIAGIHPSLDEERALGGLMPALFSFFDLVTRTDGMSDRIEELAAPPFGLALSLATGKANINFNIQADKAQHLPPSSDGSPRWKLPVILSMNGTGCIALEICARTSRPPFSTTAGIDGVTARSIRKPDRVLTLQLLGARLSSEPESSAPEDDK